MSNVLAVLLACWIGPVSVGKSAPSRLHFMAAGFSIRALDAPPGPMSHQVLMMLLPRIGGFSPNVGVRIQPHAGTIEQYAALSKRQFAAAKWTMVKETKVAAAAMVFEYSGKLRGHPMHWYAKASARHNRVYLVTATCTEAQWPKLSARLKACVDSFRLEKGTPPRSTKAPSPAKPDAGIRR